MKITTKYNIDDYVMIGKTVAMVKGFKVEGSRLMNGNAIRYFVETPECRYWSNIAEPLITRKATTKEWERGGGTSRD